LRVAAAGTGREIAGDMHLVVLALVFLVGCVDLRDGFGGDDEEEEGPHACETYTATIFDPPDGAVLPSSSVTVRVRWNDPYIPDRYLSMSDDFSHYFIPSSYEILGDGSELETYELPAGGTFNLEIGWFCDAGNNGPTVVLAKSRFKVAP
jgi:hypothetical protein